MKKITVILAALAAAFAVSCTKETPEAQLPQDQNAPAGMKQVTITASIEGADTKTSYDADGKFSWTKGDKISVMGTDYGFYTLTATSDGPTTTFTGWIPEGVTLRQEAFYPADEATNRTDGSYYFNIPMYKDLSQSFSADLPMGAYSGTAKYEFKHITGAALLTFTNFPAEVETAEISIVNARLKLTGIFNAFLSSGLWTWNSKTDVAEEERTLIRKVPVVEGQAQLYMPYNGSLWWDYTSTVNIKGYDAAGNEYVLLKDKKMKPDEATAVRGVVKKYAPLALPDYVPAVDWNKVDWAAENSVSPSVEGFTDVKVVADKYYMYARIEAPVTFAWDKLYYYMGRGEGSNALSWAWTTTAALTYNYEGTASLDALTLKYNGVTIDTKVETEGDNAYWYMAFPRNAHDITKDAGEIYFTLMGYVNGGFAGAAPLRWSPAMTVTLP